MGNPTPDPLVFLVEDDEDDRLLFEEAWQAAAVRGRVLMFPDGRAVLERLHVALSGEAQERLPHLLILDLDLPETPGLEVLAALRRHRILRALPVVILTSSLDESRIAAAYELGANGYLVKPALPEEMETMVREVWRYWFDVVALPRIRPRPGSRRPRVP
ncbi:MAG: response regulator [Candidatus Latescibacterota bacterium]